MATLALNGGRVTGGSITIPKYGPWSADLSMAEVATLPSTIVPVVAGDLTLRGTVRRSNPFAGSQSARLVGGFGGWRKVIAAKGYSHVAGVKRSSVLVDAARACGEQIDTSTDKVIGVHFTRKEAKAEQVLHFLTDGKWWIDPDGVTQIKARDASLIATPFTVISSSGSKGRYEIATESIAPWQPGRTFRAPNVTGTQTISSVQIEAANDGKLRLIVLTESAGVEERLRSDLRAIIRAELAELAYAGVWEYTVTSATAATVDCVPPDGSGMPSLSKVPMMPGLMGEVVTPTTGKKCRIVFVNQDPKRPECIGIIGDPDMIVLESGLLGAARMTDPVVAGPFAGTITGASAKVRIG